MKSWLHEISKSYIYDTLATRKDLKEHYNVLTEEEKFTLLSQNTLKYLDEQLKTVYGFGINDLTEEELGSVLMELWGEGRYRHPSEKAFRNNPRGKPTTIVDPQTGEKRTETVTDIWHRRDRRLQALEVLADKKKQSAIDRLRSKHPGVSTTPSNPGSIYTQTTGGQSHTGGELYNIALRDPEWLKGELGSMRAAGTLNRYVSHNLLRDTARVTDALRVQAAKAQAAKRRRGQTVTPPLPSATEPEIPNGEKSEKRSK